MDIIFNKLYKNDRKIDSYVCLPYKKGTRFEDERVMVFQNGEMKPTQERITAKYQDGSVKYSFLRFQCDLLANRGTVVTCEKTDSEREVRTDLNLIADDGKYILSNNSVSVELSDGSSSLFDKVTTKTASYGAGSFLGPVLKLSDGSLYVAKPENWKIMEKGPVLCRLRAKGNFGTSTLTFEVNVSLSLNSPFVDVAFRLINSTDDDLWIKAMWFAFTEEPANAFEIDDILRSISYSDKMDSDSVDCFGKDIRTMVGKSNYKTSFTVGNNGQAVNSIIDADAIIKEANEHFMEVFYGTFFADRTVKEGGVTATVYQAHQNFPKAVRADEKGIYVMLVPEDSEKIVMTSGMSKEQRFCLIFHDKDMPIETIDDLSLRYQMPDRPYINPLEFKKAEVMPNVFTDSSNWNQNVEIALIAKCDAHARAYGMLNFGDAPDPNYTTQGRGNGMLVWSNNEYDYPHACALQYARTGERRFLDYVIASARHWMDVDVCHYSKDPLLLNGQWEHTAKHNKNGVMVCSHEWVEGLLDYYHFTGDERGLETALGIGENVLRLLDTPMYQKPGEINARETGWALRSLTALYIETGDKKWTAKCEWIVDQFKVWKETYGGWIAPYTDNTLIRTGFMISVAIGSLMRYYRVFPSEDLKTLMLSAIDDLIDNATLPYGLFYYKELPSLNRLGSNTLLLEAMAIGYELTNNADYLKPGLKTFEREIKNSVEGHGGAKRHIEDAVLVGTTSPKAFAQQFIPLATFYTALLREGMINTKNEIDI